MNNETNSIEPLLERLEVYGKTSYELIKLKTLDKTANVVSTMVSRGFFVIVFSIFFCCINIGLALWLGDLIGKAYYGFFCVAGFYAIVSVVLYFYMHAWIKKTVGDSIVLQMMN